MVFVFYPEKKKDLDTIIEGEAKAIKGELWLSAFVQLSLRKPVLYVCFIRKKTTRNTSMRDTVKGYKILDFFDKKYFLLSCDPCKLQ